MSKEKSCSFKTSIGGSAVIEGVMMLGPEKMAVTVRKPDGELTQKITKVSKKTTAIKKIPILRGVVNFFGSMITSVSALMYSAEFFDVEEEAEPSKFEKWLEEKLGDKLTSVIIVFSVILSLAMSIGLFFFLPMLIINGVEFLCTLLPGGGAGILVAVAENGSRHLHQIPRSLVEGVVRISIFLAYIGLASKQKDVRRLFEYHGAEHKTIFCYEAGLPLTVENCRKQTRLHPRCGTSFLVFVMIISIILFAFVPSTILLWQRLLLKLALLPVVAGVSYEIIKWAGRSDGKLVRVLSKPGLWLQKITTREPDDDELLVAIASMEAVIPEAREDSKW